MRAGARGRPSARAGYVIHQRHLARVSRRFVDCCAFDMINLKYFGSAHDLRTLRSFVGRHPMLRPIALLLVASCLCGCPWDDTVCDPYDPRSGIPTSPPDAGELMLHADLPKGSLVCGYWDGIHKPPEPLQKGHGQVIGSDPAWTP